MRFRSIVLARAEMTACRCALPNAITALLILLLAASTAFAAPRSAAKPKQQPNVARTPRDSDTPKEPANKTPPDDGRLKAPAGASSLPKTDLPPPDTSAPPPMLPRAPRERMHACAIEWEKRKMEPKGPLVLWRDFAAKCLTR